MAIRFTIGSGDNRFSFERAPQHTAKWDEQKSGFRQALGLPAHGNNLSSNAPRA